MKKNSILIIINSLVIVFFAGMVGNTWASGKIHKIGYLEAGEFWAFDKTMHALKKAMEEMGWKDKIKFPQDAHFSPGWGENMKGECLKKAHQLMMREDLSLIVAMGTVATQSLLEANNHKTPIIAMCVSDPVKSKFVASLKDSGVDNFTVRIVPNRYKMMFEIFHDAINFKKLGLLYSDTENGRKYSSVSDAKQVAVERNFDIIEYNKLSPAETIDECVTGLQWLIDQGIDAFFIPAINCFDWTKCDTKKLFDMLMQNKIPSFARNGTRGVKAGALMGFSTVDFSQRGSFLADKVVKILQGKSPRSLNMIYNATPKISFNTYVVKNIDITPYFDSDLLAIADEIFEEITLPEDRLVK